MLSESMKPKFAIYLAAGLTLCGAAISAALGIISKIAYDVAVAPKADPNAIMELRAPDESYQRIAFALLLIATQLVVIVCARRLNGEKADVQTA